MAHNIPNPLLENNDLPNVCLVWKPSIRKSPRNKKTKLNATVVVGGCEFISELSEFLFWNDLFTNVFVYDAFI